MFLIEKAITKPECIMNKHNNPSPIELSTAERQKILVEWNNTQADYPKDKCIYQLFEEQVERTPNAIAVVFEDQQLTYDELNRRANQLAHHLQSLGIEPEVLVGICVERSLEMIVGLLGILKAGGAYVPLDPTYPKERLAFMLADAGVPILLTQEKLIKDLPEHQAQIVCLETSLENFSEENTVSEVTPENLAYVIYTSGSTGIPKGVTIQQSSILNLASALYQIVYSRYQNKPLRVSLNGSLALKLRGCLEKVKFSQFSTTNYVDKRIKK